MRFVDVMFAAVLAVALAACEPPPPCPECPRTPPVAPRDAGPTDAGQPSPPPPRDGGQELPDATAEECSEEERAAWAGFFRRLDFVEIVGRCHADPWCGEHRCAPTECIAQQAHTRCIPTLVLSCAQASCAAACAQGATSSRCRGCMCARGCVHEPDICAACDERASECGPFAVDTSLILLVVR